MSLARSSPPSVSPQFNPALLLSTSSVFPANVPYAFKIARELGYDGVELVVGRRLDTRDPGLLIDLCTRFSLPVPVVHAACFLTHSIAGASGYVERIVGACILARTLGSGTVVVHPPFRWEKLSSHQFSQLLASLRSRFGGLVLAVENMYPLPRLIGSPFRSIHWDPTVYDHERYALDLSHTAAAGEDALSLASRMSDRLAHVHFSDGRHRGLDEHLIPGAGRQPCRQLIDRLSEMNYRGALTHEIRPAMWRSSTTSQLKAAVRFTRACVLSAQCVRS